MDIKDIFDSDRAVLIGCIVIAGIFWFLNKMSQEVRWDRNLYLEYSIDQDYVFSENPRHEIMYTVEGTGWQLWGLTRRDLDTLSLNVPGRPGNHSWNSEQIRQLIRAKEIKDEIEITDVNPFRISVGLEEAFTKCMPIQINKNISFVRGYATTKGLQLSTDTVCVKGPGRLIEHKSNWQSDTLKLTEVKSSKEGVLDLQNEHPELIQLDPAAVYYNLEVIEYTELKKYAAIKLVNIPKVDSISLFPRRVLISMNVPVSKYEAAKNQEIGLFVDLKEKGTAPNSAPIQIPTNLPSWIKNIEIQPEKVEYYFFTKEEDVNE